MQEQEVRRQAMLRVMGLEVWLPRQSLPYAPASSPLLLDWQLPGPEITPQGTTFRDQQPERPVPATGGHQTVAPASAGNVQASLQQVRQSLEAGDKPVAAPATAKAEAAAVAVPVAPVVEPVRIPRFSLQLLRSGPCLLLADLPLGEAFQSSDPDFQLLRDIVRAAGLPVDLQPLRQGEPIRWPLLTAGQLAGSQDAAAARACVRDLLKFECSRAPVGFVWLLGPRAIAFANQEDADAELFSLTAFQSGIRFWNLPALEQLMQERSLKPLLWQHMQKLMAHWSGHA